MADVTVISSSIVRPRNINQSSRTKIHLAPFDLNILYIGYPQRGLLFHKPDPDTHFVSRLKTSLSVALEIYFPFSGRLVKVENLEDNTVSFYIDCEEEEEHGSSSGAKFVHAESKSLSVSDILQPDGSVPEFMRRFFPCVDVKNIDGLTEPLLAVQVTEMKDGVFISFAYNHMVADGASVWRFFNTWSKICSGVLMKNHNPPLKLRGWFLDGISFPIRIPASEMVALLQAKKLLCMNLSYLKAKANTEAGSSDAVISSLQALSAHLWRSVMRHSGLSREEETYCKVAVDFRQRLNPPLEKECFGNVVFLGVASVTVGELLDHEMGWAALQINKMVRSQTDEKYKTNAKNWVRNVKILKTFGAMVCDSVAVTSSPWFDVYGNDFGWGKPIAARARPMNSMRGSLVLLQGIEEGSIDVHATLWSHVLVKLLADVEFLENMMQ
ncbi:putative acetyltransferase [Raphanus sativus]|nr:putative acetyltransferase [Raphanus sativus]